MLLMIITDKTIARFQNALKTSLDKNGFKPEQTALIIPKATEHFKAIARANALKPKSLPDTGLDVLAALKDTQKRIINPREAITNNPSLLFTANGLVVPEQSIKDVEMSDDANATSTAKKPRLPRAPSRKRVKTTAPDIHEVISAARREFSDTGLRPDMGIGIIRTGALKGTKWSAVHRSIVNDTDFMLREGITSLAKLFDTAMVGARHKPCDPKKARDAFCEAFETAAKNMTGGYTSLINVHRTQRPKRDLPYVLQMVEASMIALETRGKNTMDSVLVDAGPLAGMNMTTDNVDDLFHCAKNINPSFPFFGLNDFIADRDVRAKAKAAAAPPIPSIK